MSKLKTTPHPWEWAKAKGSGITFDEEGFIYPPDAEQTGGYQHAGPLAVVSISEDSGGEANGLLMTAAPELLAALEAVLRTGLNGGNNVRLSLMAASRMVLSDADLERAEQSEKAVEMARAAIAKAKGESNG